MKNNLIVPICLAALSALAPARAQTTEMQPAATGPLPLLATYPMTPDAATPAKLDDAGPLKIDGTLQGASFQTASFGTGGNAGALHFDGAGSRALFDGPLIQKLGTNFSFAFWLKLDTLPVSGVDLLQKGSNTGFQIQLSPKGNLCFHGSWGGGWYDAGAWSPSLPVGTWTHVVFTFESGAQGRFYFNGKHVSSGAAPHPFYPEPLPLQFGGDKWSGAIGDLKIYAAALTGAQAQALYSGTSPDTRPAQEGDLPPIPFPVDVELARFDQPLGNVNYDARRYQTAVRVPGPDAVDWPGLTFDGKTPLFQGPKAETFVGVELLSESQAMPSFRQPYDHVILPINSWLRANHWRWGRRFVYTTERTARTSSSDYELWAFPVRISAEGDAGIQSVKLTLGDTTVYARDEVLHSLTLLLPANENGAPYQLWVNGRGPVAFNVGLQPAVPGHPDDEPLPVDATLPGPGSEITAKLDLGSGGFPNQKEWDADAKVGSESISAPVLDPPALGTGRFLGTVVPRSPVAVFTTSMRAGMSGGHKFGPDHLMGYQGTPEEYAAYLKSNGYDWVFDDATPEILDGPDRPLEHWAQAMNTEGLKFGLNPDIPGNLGILSNPNLAFQSTYLGEWGKPAYRDAQLLADRFGAYPNFLGLFIGADNAGYVSYWDWAPTIPDRPWGRAYEQFQNGREPITPVGPAIAPQKQFERKATEAAFLDYIHRYDATFARYGYFAKAVQEAAPNAILTSGSFGSSPGVGGRGGWPWATIPGREMLGALPVQVTYDWNELPCSLPLHNVALIDRARSYNPEKPTWALIDDYGLFFGREARQRAYALALTRGVDAVGTTFLAHPTGDPNANNGVAIPPRPRAQVIAEQQELYAWVKKWGGVYHGTQLLPQVGVLYVHEQAISRPVVGGETPSDDQLARGSHEGKTTEALFLCHMAGYPAKIITPEELKRGLPPAMKAILLTGLNRFDNTWLWSDGLEPSLQAFVQGGGKLLLDDDSVAPAGVPATSTGLHIASYVVETMLDQSPILLARNAANVTKLRAALAGIPAPVAQSSDPTVWAIPHQTGDVQYVTVVNWANVPGQNASLVVRGQVGQLTWSTNRPIYDLTLGRRVTSAEASSVDLTHDAVRVYALPPAVPVAPAVRFDAADGRVYAATVTVGAGAGMAGVPVQVTVTEGTDTATVYGASGQRILLPVATGEAGSWSVTATELLSGLSSTRDLQVTAAPKVAPDASAQTRNQVTTFLNRHDVPLVVALTPSQAEDATTTALANRLVNYFSAHGRPAQIRKIAPGDVVVSLQTMRAQQRYPQWETIDADLVLIGSPQDNLLIMDQARGHILSDAALATPAGGYAVTVTHSPFVGERWALNLVAPDAAGVSAAALAVTGNQ